MKDRSPNRRHLWIIAGLVAVAAAVLYLAYEVAALPDEARIAALIDERIRQAPRAASGAAAPDALTDANIVALIDKHLSRRASAGLSEERVTALIEARLAQHKAAGSAAPAAGGLTRREVADLIDGRLEQQQAELWSDEAFDARVEQAILAFIQKQQRAERERADQLYDKVRPVGARDHIRGSPNAPVAVIEYSDFECPFCKRFHATLKQVVGEYDGRVRWVYRHFPLEQLHPVKARKAAIASECAAEIGGNEAFWKFTDRYYELTPSNNRTDLATVFPRIAREVGLDEAKFGTCLESGRHERRIDDDYRNAQASGGNGTPWTVILAASGKAYPVSGAQSYAAVKQLIDLALRDN